MMRDIDKELNGDRGSDTKESGGIFHSGLTEIQEIDSISLKTSKR